MCMEAFVWNSMHLSTGLLFPGSGSLDFVASMRLVGQRNHLSGARDLLVMVVVSGSLDGAQWEVLMCDVGTIGAQVDFRWKP